MSKLHDECCYPNEVIERVEVLTIDDLLELRSIDVVIRREEWYSSVTFQLGIALFKQVIINPHWKVR